MTNAAWRALIAARIPPQTASRPPPAKLAAAVARDRVPGLAGRIKRRPETRGRIRLPLVPYAHIYACDRHRPGCPVCTRRNVTPHHVRYRSRGGDDTDENVTSACSHCHLGVIHSGVIRVEGPASKLSWSIGRERSLVVVGREKVGR